MKSFSPPNSHIHIIVRAFITSGDKVILCRTKNEPWFFLPGGHVEDGESLTEALLRELKEEFGDKSFSKVKFIGLCENIFDLDDNHTQHEINAVFHLKLIGKDKIISNEAHLDFLVVEKNELESLQILPDKLKSALLTWLDTGATFFTEL